MQLYQSKIFANGSTTLPKAMHDALDVRAGDSLRHVITEDGVQIFKIPSEQDHADEPALREALDAAEVAMDQNRTLLRKLK